MVLTNLFSVCEKLVSSLVGSTSLGINTSWFFSSNHCVPGACISC